MKPTVTLASKNEFKVEKLRWIVEDYFNPENLSSDVPEQREEERTFQKIAEQKAIGYSRHVGGYAISTDGGAVIPALGEAWDPIHTKRFAESDEARIKKLLKLMEGKQDRTVEWHESLALAKDGMLLFSTTQRAMDGVVDTHFNPAYYEPGIWLCSVTSFPELGGKNFFELTPEERLKTEDSWTKLKLAFVSFCSSTTL